MTNSSPGITLKSKAVAFAMMIVLAAVAFCAMPLVAHAAAGGTPPHTKNLIDNQDGTYTLSLDVVGESEKKPNPVNVIVIMDNSGSMDTRTGGYGSQTRMAAAQNAVNNLARSLYAYNTTEFPNLVQMALVGFSTKGTVTQAPTNSYNTFSGAVNGLDADGGTNWEDALQDAAGISFGDNDPTYVIFVSDGNPTFRNTRGNYSPMDNYYYNTWGVYGNGSDSQWVDGIAPETTIERCYDHAVDDAAHLASAIGADRFYTIGAYGNVSRMQSLTTDAGAPAGNYYSAANTTDLQNALAAILAQIEKAGIGSVEIEDGTTNQVTASSGVVELLEVDTNSFKYYKDGEEWAEAPKASFENGAVEWDLSGEGVLDNGVKYTVTFDCYPSQYTYDTIAKLKNGDITYDSLDSEVKKYIVDNGNGTYSLRTNKTATLDWDDTRTDDDEQAVAYVNPDPVRTDAATMSVTKAWENELDARAVGSIDMTVLMGADEFHEVTLSDPTWRVENIYISPGIIKKGQVLSGAEGHDFTFAELGPEQYNWELVSPIVHPMIVDGTLTMLTLIDSAHPAPAGAQTYTINGKNYYSNGSSSASLDAYNYRRSNLNLTKVVTGEDAPEDATFPFTLTVNNSKAASGSADDTNSDYYVWFSIYDTKAGATVMDANVTGAIGPSTSGYYYAPSGTPITVDMKDSWNLRFTNLPTGTTYTFAEGDLAVGFAFNKAELTSGADKDTTFSGNKTSTGTIQATNTSYTVTYTNDYELTDLEITKVWEDADNQDGIRLTADELKAKLTLSPAVQGAEPAIKDNGDGTYTITYTGLPRFNNGQEVTYTVTESAIDGYSTTGSPAEDHGTITNTHEPEVTEVTVVKVWDDSDDIGEIRPASIQAQLKADGTASGDPVTLDEGNKWTYTWENLPKYADGEEIEYTADETAVPAGYDKSGPVKTTAEDGTVTFTVTNTYNPTPVSVDPPVQKVIENDPGLYNEGDFTFTIEATSPADAPMPAKTSITNVPENEFEGKTGFYEFGEITFTMPGTYTYTVKESGGADGVTNDPAAATGKTLTFTVTDDGKGNLTVSPTTDQVQLSFTNVYDADGEASIVVTKEITGAAWPASKTLTLALAGSGEAPMPEETTATMNAAGSVTFGPISYALSDAGKTYAYTITEDGFGDGWTGSPTSITATVKVTDNGDGTLATEVSYTPENATITNTYKAEGYIELLAGKKLEVKEPAYNPPDVSGAYTITIAGADGAPMPATTSFTNADGKGTATSFGAIKYDESDAGKTYTYTITEEGEVDGVTNGQTSYNVKVKVTDNGDGTLAAEVVEGKATTIFTNTYSVTPVTLDTDQQFLVTKDLTGTPLTAGAFEFELKDASGKVIQSKTNNAAGEALFDAITYTAPGEYTYTITEVNGGVGGYSYDTNVVTVIVSVIDNGKGALEASVEYSGSTEFVNTYEATGAVNLTAAKELKGRTLEAGQFTFELLDEDGNVIQTKTNNASGAVQFDAIEYDQTIFDEDEEADEKDADEEKADEKKAAKKAADGEAADEADADATADDEAEADATVDDEAADEGATDEVTTEAADADSQETADEPAATTESASILPQAYADEFDDSKVFASEANDAAVEDEEPEAAKADNKVKAAAKAEEKAADERTKEFKYTIREVNDGKAGYAYDGHEIAVTVTVTDNGDGTLTATPEYSGAQEFVNTYTATGKVDLFAAKEVTGATLAAGQFSFQLKGPDGSVLQTVANDEWIGYT